MQKKVLVIDKDAGVLKNTGRALKGMFDIDLAQGPARGFGLVANRTYDLIIVGHDFGPGRINGISLINLIKLQSTARCVLSTANVPSARCYADGVRNKPDGYIDNTQGLTPETLVFWRVK